MLSKLNTNSGSASSVSTLVPATATACVIGGLLLRKWWRARQEPPKFKMGLPIVGPIQQFLKDPMELIRLGQKKCGECFGVNFLAMDMIFLVGPDAQQLFFTMDKYLDQSKMYKFTVPIFGPKVLYDVDQSTRACQLKFIRERLTDSCLRSYTESLEEEVIQFFQEEWPGDSGTVDIRESMQECLTRTSVRCLMGRELRRRLHDAVDGYSIVQLLHILEKGMLPLSVFWPHAPIPRHRERDNARRLMHEIVAPILAERRKNTGKTEKDFMQSVLVGNYPDGTKITDEEIVGFLVAAFFGGMHNSSITTSWSALEIFSRPEFAKELLEEQRAVLGSDDAPFTFDGYNSMKKLRSAVSETLRMHPPLFLLMRTVVDQDVTFKNYKIRRGNVVAVSPNVGCMLDEVYPKAKEFDPKRFINGLGNEYAYIPFGGGRRVCKGQEFGYMQVMCVISYMMRNFEIETPDGVTEPTVANDGMVIAPSQPCRLTYRRKKLAK